MKRNMKITGAVGIAALVAAGGFAFTVSNTVPANANLGYGSTDVSGATATAMSFGLTPDHTKIDAVNYVVDALSPGATASITVTSLGTNGGPFTYPCIVDANRTALACSTTAPVGTVPAQLTVAEITNVGLLVK